jgi:hypothetical protein
MFDLGGEWCISSISEAHLSALIGRLKSLEKMTAAEIFSGDPGKDYDLNVGLPNRQAMKRLRELRYDDRDQISRLRIGRRERLYGFRYGHNFYALWWDPQHEIWP